MWDNLKSIAEQKIAKKKKVVDPQQQYLEVELGKIEKKLLAKYPGVEKIYTDTFKIQESYERDLLDIQNSLQKQFGPKEISVKSRLEPAHEQELCYRRISSAMYHFILKPPTVKKPAREDITIQELFYFVDPGTVGPTSRYGYKIAEPTTLWGRITAYFMSLFLSVLNTSKKTWYTNSFIRKMRNISANHGLILPEGKEVVAEDPSSKLDEFLFDEFTKLLVETVLLRKERRLEKRDIKKVRNFMLTDESMSHSLKKLVGEKQRLQMLAGNTKPYANSPRIRADGVRDYEEKMNSCVTTLYPEQEKQNQKISERLAIDELNRKRQKELKEIEEESTKKKVEDASKGIFTDEEKERMQKHIKGKL